MFITFEGGEGSGKSTQVKLLAEYLKKQGRVVAITREPGGTPTAEKIREILLGNSELTPQEQCFLNFAARIDHVEKMIKPALKNGVVVISDRFFDSTYAYQGYAQGLPIKTIKSIHKAAINNFKPDLTIILDIDPLVAKKRIGARGGQNHYDKQKLDFHKKIRAAFLDIAARNKRRCVVISAAKPAEKVAADIIKAVSKKLK